MYRIISLILIAVFLLVAPVKADEFYASYLAAGWVPEDDNFGMGKGFYGQAGEVGYSWRYLEIGTEYFATEPKTLFGSTFLDNSVMGTIKIKYPLPWKYLRDFTPYGVAGVGMHFFTDKNMKNDPIQSARGNPYNPSESIENGSSIALKWGAGIEYKMSDHFSIFGEVTYRYGDTGEPSSIDVYAWSYGGGIKVRF